MNFKMMPGINTTLWHSFAIEQISQRTLQIPRYTSQYEVQKILCQAQCVYSPHKKSKECCWDVSHPQSIKMHKMVPGYKQEAFSPGLQHTILDSLVTRQNKAWESWLISSGGAIWRQITDLRHFSQNRLRLRRDVISLSNNGYWWGEVNSFAKS